MNHNWPVLGQDQIIFVEPGFDAGAVLAQFTWYHNHAILKKLTLLEDHIWYAKATVEHGWSRNVLVHQIEAKSLHRQGKAVADFERTLPALQSDLARDLSKDLYNSIFSLSATTPGNGIWSAVYSITCASFSSNLEWASQLLEASTACSSKSRISLSTVSFYHLKLRAYVVIDLKMNALEPEFAERMNFYLSAVNDLIFHPDDQAAKSKPPMKQSKVRIDPAKVHHSVDQALVCTSF